MRELHFLADYSTWTDKQDLSRFTWERNELMMYFVMFL